MLFERLAHPVDIRGTGDPPARVHDAEGLRNSVLRQLRCLLNTRVPLDIDTLEEREPSVFQTIDYANPQTEILQTKYESRNMANG